MIANRGDAELENPCPPLPGQRGEPNLAGGYAAFSTGIRP